jgi:hypothetical protein
MQYAICKYNGKSERIGRFGIVSTGQNISLTPSEYRSVKENPEFTFIEYSDDELPRGPMAHAQGPDPTSPGVPPKKGEGKADAGAPGARTVAEALNAGVPLGQKLDLGDSTGKADAPVGEEPGAEWEEAELPYVGEGLSDYSSLKVDELRAEIEIRNEDREGEALIVPASMRRKADLIAALEADDAGE